VRQELKTKDAMIASLRQGGNVAQVGGGGGDFEDEIDPDKEILPPRHSSVNAMLEQDDEVGRYSSINDCLDHLVSQKRARMKLRIPSHAPAVCQF